MASVLSSWRCVGALCGLDDPMAVRSSRGPSKARYLSFRNHSLSLSTSTSSMWCVDTSTAVFSFLRRMSFLTSSLVHESHPLLGSSSSRIFGDPQNARARASLLFMPPMCASGRQRDRERERERGAISYSNECDARLSSRLN